MIICLFFYYFDMFFPYRVGISTSSTNYLLSVYQGRYLEILYRYVSLSEALNVYIPGSKLVDVISARVQIFSGVICFIMYF